MIPLESWGSAGPIILCVHGIGSSRRDFARLGTALAATHRVFAYDQRGHGDRGGDEASMRLEDAVADLHDVAAQIPGVVATVVGASWGGAVALLGGPSIAQSLVLVDPLLSVAPGTFSEYVDDLAPFAAIPPGEQRNAAVREAFADADPVDRDAKVHALRKLELESITRLGEENGVDAGGWNVSDRLRGSIPRTTILLAGIDSVVRPDDLRELDANVDVRTVEGHGHTLHRSAMPLFVRTVAEAADSTRIA